MYGYRVVLRVMKTKQRPTAIFAHNDTLALGVYRGLYEMGFKIPDDISVVGYDDLPSCELVHPPLTSVGTPLNELAAIAVGLLMERIKQLELEQSKSGPAAVRQKIALNPKLVVRQSTNGNRNRPGSKRPDSVSPIWMAERRNEPMLPARSHDGLRTKNGCGMRFRSQQ
jgi:DNA-binding LacI/PurR family transcriptional regulator